MKKKYYLLSITLLSLTILLTTFSIYNNYLTKQNKHLTKRYNAYKLQKTSDLFYKMNKFEKKYRKNFTHNEQIILDKIFDIILETSQKLSYENKKELFNIIKDKDEAVLLQIKQIINIKEELDSQGQ